MNLLAIDTSTERATVAIAVGNELYCEEQDGIREHAKLLLPMVERLLLQAGVTFKELDAIVFGCGPGSFTGLRIACSVAKGLAYAHDLPLYPVSSLATIAYEASLTGVAGAHILAMIDARMQQVYWGHFIQEFSGGIEQVSAAADVKLPTTQPVILAGAGFETYVQQLPEAVQSQIIKQCVIYPNAKTMIHLVQSGQVKAVSVTDALPIYVRDQVTQGGESRG